MANGSTLIQHSALSRVIIAILGLLKLNACTGIQFFCICTWQYTVLWRNGGGGGGDDSYGN